MTEHGALYRLLAWLSPGYPIGAYTYSHGMEQAVEAGFIEDAEAAQAWIADIVEYGAGVSDTVFLAHTHGAVTRGDEARLREVCELAAVFATTRELALETHAQGAAFLEITGTAWHAPALDALRQCWDGAYAYPVVVGCAAAGHGIALEDAATGYLHAFAANLVSASVRLVPLGQSDGQHVMASLETCVAATAREALKTRFEDTASATLMVDISSMKHETQYTRLFRS